MCSVRSWRVALARSRVLFARRPQPRGRDPGRTAAAIERVCRVEAEELKPQYAEGSSAMPSLRRAADSDRIAGRTREAVSLSSPCVSCVSPKFRAALLAGSRVLFIREPQRRRRDPHRTGTLPLLSTPGILAARREEGSGAVALAGMTGRAALARPWRMPGPRKTRGWGRFLATEKRRRSSARGDLRLQSPPDYGQGIPVRSNSWPMQAKSSVLP